MKSLANSVLTVELALLKDAQAAYPEMGVSLERDRKRLSLLSEDRGEGLWTLDLPCLAKMLKSGLETGRLSLEGPLSRAVSKRIQVPKLFSGLWLRVFSKNGCLKENADINAIMFLYQLAEIGSKLAKSCSPNRLKQAIEEYFNVERQTVEPTLKWSLDELDPDRRLSSLHIRDCMDDDLPLFPAARQDRRTGSLLDRCQNVFDMVVAELGFFEPITYSGAKERENLGTGFRHGPGAVADRSGVVNKYDFPRWSSKLEEWFPYRDIGTVASDKETHPLNHEVASRLIAVAKTAKSPRLIAAEPTEHQFCQQLTRDFLTERLRSLFGQTFICFERQDLSQQMALRASLTGDLATVDLSSASDRLSCWLVERGFRRNPSILHALHASRTRWLQWDDGRRKTYVKLKKFAAQGTAVTFPVQTLVFLCLALGCSIRGKPTWTKIRRLRNKVRVFGDDIIIPRNSYADLVCVLTLLGLKVNENKSFSEGFFRESCGMDAYKGYDITPCKPEHLTSDGPASRMAVLDTSNNLFAKGYWHASLAIESSLGRLHLRRLPIVGRDLGITGRYSFCGTSLDHLKERWNRELHRREFYMWRLRTKSERVVFGERFSLLQFFTEAPGGHENWQPGTEKRSATRDGLGWAPVY